MIKDQKVEEFLSSVASSSPTPGGGAVAAITAGAAAALVEMVVNLTKGDEIKKIGEDASKKRQLLLTLADEDAKAFDEVMAAFRIPKEDSLRKERIQAAFKVAAEVPLQVAQVAKEINQAAKIVQKLGNKNALSDARTALYLSDAAKKSAMENVKINLLYLKDEVFIGKMKSALAALK